MEHFVRDSDCTSLEQRVKTLEEGKKEDFDAIHTVYPCSGADRNTVNTLSAQVRAQDYMIQILESELAAERHQSVVSAQERCYIFDQFEEFVLYVMTRFGR